jgi:hypothetical protein
MWIFWTIVISVVGLLLFLYSCTGDGWQGLAGQFYVWCLLAVILIVGVNTSEPIPTALDVYRGKTTLEYTIRDGEIIDSVVVFKEYEKNLDSKK